jgi:hypothetical protein
LTDDILKLTNLIQWIILIITLGILYTRANLFYVNPTLSLWGYKIYKITDTEDNNFILITKKTSITRNTLINKNDFSGNIFVENEGNTNKTKNKSRKLFK